MNLKKTIRYYAGYARPTVERIGLRGGSPSRAGIQALGAFHFVAGWL
jgi:hypothetical protein